MRPTLLTLLLLLVCSALFANGAAAENIASGLRVVVIDAGHGGKFLGRPMRDCARRTSR